MAGAEAYIMRELCRCFLDSPMASGMKKRIAMRSQEQEMTAKVIFQLPVMSNCSWQLTWVWTMLGAK